MTTDKHDENFVAKMIAKRLEWSTKTVAPIDPRMIRRGGVLASCDSAASPATADDSGHP